VPEKASANVDIQKRAHSHS